MKGKSEYEEVILTPIPAYRGFSNYLADTMSGRIWSKKSNKFLACTPNDNGYVYVTLIDDNGKSNSYGVHRLIMASMSGIPIEQFKRGGIEVDHYPNEEEKHNNSISNLQMSSRKLQYRESIRAKMGKGKRLKEEQVCEILEQLQEWESDENNKLSDFIHMAAEAYGQGYRNLWNIVYGKTWKHLHNEVSV
ncbi:hypothetical protein [Bacillus sp. ISL-7]|uniref:hypothetical protein n=1 Tax=Bacillus sp. ISL-7 TaxID=2819136 RepID=UPI001BE7CCA6|nr:hypothetical protein [Bacillus sp. ISL-7]MBT2736150.1 hypothetical protein [Bacillus sp. ISL-7]